MDIKPVKRRKTQTVRRNSKSPAPADKSHAESINLPPIDMDLTGQTAETRAQLIVKKGFWRRNGKWAMRGLLLVLVGIVGITAILFSQGIWKLHKVFRGTTATAVALKADVQPMNLKTEGNGRINVLLMGRGGGNHEAPDLTDTMILASIDPVNNSAVMVSIPRDLWVKLPGGGTGKINSAWETGEFKYVGSVSPGSTDPKAIDAGYHMVDHVVTDVTGVNIDYNILVDFQAFQQGVDTVGGVTVNVPEDLVDPTMADENHWNPVLAKAGVQTFNGTQALMYVRSRETTSDFARSLRQRSVLLALKTKLQTLGTLSNPLKIATLMNTFGNNVATDISLSDAARLYDVGRNINQSKITSIGFSDPPNAFVTTGPMNGQSIVLPRAGLYTYNDIQNYLRTQLKDGYIVKENAKIQIINATGKTNAGTLEEALLKSYGYNVTATANSASQQTSTQLVNLTKGKDKYTQHYLEQRLKVVTRTSMPANSIPTSGADFVIILGSDETGNQ